MDINIGNINALTTTINKSFNKYIETAAPTFGRFTMTIPSNAGENFYPRLAEMPGLREWVGQRVIHRLEAGGFVIRNRTFEETLGRRWRFRKRRIQNSSASCPRTGRGLRRGKRLGRSAPWRAPRSIVIRRASCARWP